MYSRAAVTRREMKRKALPTVFDRHLPLDASESQNSGLPALHNDMGDWTADFAEREGISLAILNRPIFDLTGLDDNEDATDGAEDGDGGEDDQTELDDDTEEQSVIQRVVQMWEPLDWVPGIHHQVTDKLESFCSGANLDDIRDGAVAEARRPAAHLYDRSSKDGLHVARPDKGCLTAHHLCRELEKPVSMSPSRVLPSEGSRLTCSSVSSTLSPQIPVAVRMRALLKKTRSMRNAVQCMMRNTGDYRSLTSLMSNRHIWNLDRSFMLVLLSTVTGWNQAAFLGPALYRHLIFESSISLNVMVRRRPSSPGGFLIFDLCVY